MPPSERALRQLCAAAGYRSLAAAARAAGSERHTLVALATGTRRLRPATLDRIAAALGIPAELLARVSSAQ